VIVQAIAKLVEGYALTPEEVAACASEMADGLATPSQMAAFLTALRIRGESPEVLAAMARVMRERAVRVRAGDGAIDTCGTGGDSLKTVNASTIAALAVAAAGGKVAKHGNRSFTGHTGSADILEELGVNVGVGPEVVERSIESTGFGFMLAPLYHPSMRNVSGVRREIGIRTAFNLVGPLSNPALVSRQTVGVPSPQLVPVVSDALRHLGLEVAAVYHGLIGVDEVSPCSPTEVAWLEQGEVRRAVLKPEDFGMEPADPKRLVVRDREEAVRRTKRLISGDADRDDPDAKLVVCNASVALVVAGIADDLEYGAELSWEVLTSGKLLSVLRQVIGITGGDPSRLEGST